VGSLRGWKKKAVLVEGSHPGWMKTPGHLLGAGTTPPRRNHLTSHLSLARTSTAYKRSKRRCARRKDWIVKEEKEDLQHRASAALRLDWHVLTRRHPRLHLPTDKGAGRMLVKRAHRHPRHAARQLLVLLQDSALPRRHRRAKVKASLRAPQLPRPLKLPPVRLVDARPALRNSSTSREMQGKCQVVLWETVHRPHHNSSSNRKRDLSTLRRFSVLLLLNLLRNSSSSSLRALRTHNSSNSLGKKCLQTRLACRSFSPCSRWAMRQ
jgi:hypothetical protein